MHFRRFLLFSISALTLVCHSLWSQSRSDVQTELTATLFPPGAELCIAPAGTPVAALASQQSKAPQRRAVSSPPAAAAPGSDIMSIAADNQQKDGSITHLRGNAEIIYREMRLTGDEIDYNEETQIAEVRGHVHFESKQHDENIYAESGRFNLGDSTGQFYKVQGSYGARLGGKNIYLTTTNPFFFDAPRADRLGEDEYKLYDGFVTSCKMPKPFWTFQGADTEVRPGEVFKVRNAWLKLRGVPVFFTPYFRHSLQSIPRQSGFLTPNFGTSSVKGTFIGDGFFWAINRSTDATVIVDYYSTRGPAETAFFRFRGNGNTYFDANIYAVQDRGPITNGVRGPSQGGENLAVNGAIDLPAGFRGVVNVNYLSSYAFRLAFTQAYNEAIGTEVHTTAFVAKHFDSYDFNVAVFRFQDFQSTNPGDSVEIRSLPSVQLSGRDREIFKDLPVYFSFDSAADALNRSQINLSTPAFVGRFDVFPRVTTPLHIGLFDVTASLGFRATAYTASIETTGSGAPQQLLGTDRVRTAGVFDLDIRPPALEKIFKSPFKFLGDRLKHVIEPRIAFRYVDGIENAQSYILFDERDIMVNTKQLEYGVTQHLYGKRDPNGAVKEILSWDLKQVYYFDPTFGGALIPGQRNVVSPSIDFSAYAFLDQPRRFSPVQSNLKLYPSHRFSVESLLAYDTVRHRLVAGSMGIGVRQGKMFANIGHEFVRSDSVIAAPANQLRTTIGYGSSHDLGPNIAWLAVPDLKNGFLQYSAVQASYNLDCCGLTAEWRRYAFGPARNENQWRIAISFANVGTFGRIKKRELLF